MKMSKNGAKTLDFFPDVLYNSLAFAKASIYAPLAQLDRALVYGTKGWGFELLMARQSGTLLSSVPFSFLPIIA